MVKSPRTSFKAAAEPINPAFLPDNSAFITPAAPKPTDTAKFRAAADDQRARDSRNPTYGNHSL